MEEEEEEMEKMIPRIDLKEVDGRH